MTISPSEEILTLKEVAQQLGVHDATVRNWLRKGKIQARKIDRRWIFLAQTVREMKCHSTREQDPSVGRSESIEKTARRFARALALGITTRP